MSPWDRLIETPDLHGHIVQFCGDNQESLTPNLVRFLAEGVRLGEPVIVIAQSAYSASLQTALADVLAVGSHGPQTNPVPNIVWLDANGTLQALMRNGLPDWQAFQSVVGQKLSDLRATAPVQPVRAYGEMVSMLWKSRHFAAAIRLEHFWNKLLSQTSLSLFCAYSVDFLNEDVSLDTLESILATHTHVVPERNETRLDAALLTALTEVAGPRAKELRAAFERNANSGVAIMPRGERFALWIRRHLPEHAPDILARARHHRDSATN